jgi:hypothetical protein
MVSENPPPPKRVPPRTYSPLPAPRPSPRPYRLGLRLIGIPAAAVVGVFIYSGLRDRLVLPECDSENAKRTLSDILKQLNLEPTRYEPLKTVSSTKDQVVCNASLPRPDGATVVVDYTFYWQGNKADMKYSVSRKAPGNS